MRLLPLLSVWAITLIAIGDPATLSPEEREAWHNKQVAKAKAALPADLVDFYEATEAFNDEHLQRWEAFEAGHPDGEGRKAHEASLRAVIEEHPGSVDRLVALARACDEPFRVPDDVNASEMRFALTRHTGSFSKVRDPIRIDAMMRLEASDIDGAADRVADLLAMSRTVAEIDPSVKGHLLSISLVREALDTLEKVEAEAELSPQRLTHLADMLESQVRFFESYATPMLEGERDHMIAMFTESASPGIGPSKFEQAKATRVLNERYADIIELWPDASASDQIVEIDERMHERLFPDWALSEESMLGRTHRKYNELHRPRMMSAIERLRAGEAE
ncbi:MAG: hypothetical protein AAGD00_00395 [Planctomycetota bacterium]